MDEFIPAVGVRSGNALIAELASVTNTRKTVVTATNCFA